MVGFAADRDPDAPALVYDGVVSTFAELRDRIERLAAGVGSLTEPGDRIAILAENTPEFVEAYYGVPRAGARLVFLNYRLHPSEWSALLDASGARVLIGERELLDQLGSPPLGVEHVVAIDDARGPELAYSELLGDVSAPVSPPAIEDDAVAWIIYTSGTTGRPKGAMLTHRSLTAGINALAIARPIEPDDVYLFPFPLCHVAGYNVLAFHRHGRPVVLLRRFDADAVVAATNRHRVTQISLAPTMIEMLLRVPDLDAAAVPTLRGIGYGASPIPADVLRRGVDQLGCDFSQGYGMTELSGNAVYLDADDHRRACAGDESLLAAAGRPSPLVSVRIVDDNGRELPDGEVGEIVVRGDQVMRGYWNDPEATADALRDGRLHTGDVGRIDERGYLSVVDRKKDIIVTGGENVASREVEEALRLHSSVGDVAVIGVPDPTWGESVCAVVVAATDPPPDPEALITHVRGRLAGYKRPKHVVFVDELPRNAAGKVLKRELRATVPPTV